MELERAGIPTAQICSLTPVATSVGSNRMVPSVSVLHPVGNPALGPEVERKLRRAIVERALEALQTPVVAQQVFPGAS